jgi:ketosteroid isomerase-like protein
MRRILGISALLLAVTALAVRFSSPSTIALGQTNDEDEIRALEHRFADAFKAKDVDRIMANYAHSQDLLFFDVVPRPTYLGWEAYKKDWQSFFDSIGPVALFEVRDLAVSVDGNVAYSYSFQHYLAKTKTGGSRNVTVRVTDVYRKRGGKWLIVQEHVSVPLDPATGKADIQFIP